MSEQKRCPDCNCDLEKANCECAVEDNSEKLKQSFESSNMLTESELMAELEKDAEVIRTHFLDCEICESKESGNKALMLFVDSERYFIGNEFEYRPDSVAPAKGRTVISRSGRIWVSAGEFHNDMLMVFDYSEDDNIAHLRHWCDFFDRSHHSPGWCKE